MILSSLMQTQEGSQCNSENATGEIQHKIGSNLSNKTGPVPISTCWKGIKITR